MPPKKDEKKEIVAAFDPPKFWQYRVHSSETLDKTVAFLTNFEKQLIQLINQQKTLQQNYELICQKIGIAVHPCLRYEPKEESKYPELHNNDYGDRFLQLLNFKIDAVSLKILAFLITHFKITSLKLSRNEINNEVEDLKKLLEKQTSSTLLFLQWNPLLESPIRSDIFLTTVRPNLQHLILRQNMLGNDLARQILKKIKATPQIVLKSLDLTGNCLTPQISEQLCLFIQQEKNIQFLGLSKNQLNGKQFLTKIFNCIGEIPLNEQEYAKHLEAIKARDQVLERNKKKKKGAADEPVPFVFEIKETQNGKFYVKNTSLQNLNLAKNGLGDSTGNALKNFAEGQGAKVQVFLDGNRFSKRWKDMFRAYGNLLI